MPKNYFSLHDLDYISREVHRQGDPARFVANMGRALKYAREKSRMDVPDEWAVTFMAGLVKGTAGEYRQVYVRVGDSAPIGYENIERQMASLIANWGNPELSDDEWYREFEEVHPFIDGNGRVGSLLWNWRRGSLGEPQDPPNFWG